MCMPWRLSFDSVRVRVLLFLIVSAECVTVNMSVLMTAVVFTSEWRLSVVGQVV